MPPCCHRGVAAVPPPLRFHRRRCRATPKLPALPPLCRHHTSAAATLSPPPPCYPRHAAAAAATTLPPPPCCCCHCCCHCHAALAVLPPPSFCHCRRCTAAKLLPSCGLRHHAVGSYKLPLVQYTCIGQVVACSFQQKYGFSQVLLVWPADTPLTSPIKHLRVGGLIRCFFIEAAQCFVGSVSSKVPQQGLEPPGGVRTWVIPLLESTSYHS